MSTLSPCKGCEVEEKEEAERDRRDYTVILSQYRRMPVGGHPSCRPNNLTTFQSALLLLSETRSADEGAGHTHNTQHSGHFSPHPPGFPAEHSIDESA